MIGFLLGALTSAIVWFFVYTRDQWAALPRTWKREPDCSLRGWFRTARRALRPTRHARCALCAHSHLLSNDPHEN